MSEETDNQEAGAVDDWAEAMAEQAVAEAARDESGDASAAEFDSLEDTSGGPAGEEANLDVILDIPVTISMEIGRTHISIRNLLQLNQGSVVELDRLAGEPMDVLVNGTLVAHGEVVVVKGNTLGGHAVAEPLLDNPFAHHLEGGLVDVDADDLSSAQPREFHRRRTDSATDVENARQLGLEGRQQPEGPAGVLEKRLPQLEDAQHPIQIV